MNIQTKWTSSKQTSVGRAQAGWHHYTKHALLPIQTKKDEEKRHLFSFQKNQRGIKGNQKHRRIKLVLKNTDGNKVTSRLVNKQSSRLPISSPSTKRTETHGRLPTNRLNARAKQRRHGTQNSRNAQQKKGPKDLPFLHRNWPWVHTRTETPAAANPVGFEPRIGDFGSSGRRSWWGTKREWKETAGSGKRGRGMRGGVSVKFRSVAAPAALPGWRVLDCW